jgi:valyl-tRNA synthetase
MGHMNMPKAYEPAKYEDDIYALWEKSNAFAPKEKGEAYSIVMPPPNANGTLHVGHSMMIGIQDIAIRYNRLKGKRVLYLPGADHAGFETQVVYERSLAKEGKSRFDVSREELYRGIWDFVAESRGKFDNNLRRLGASADWERFTFTLDDRVIDRTYKTFKKLWEDGLVYRGERLVNFCTFHGTAFADIEVEHKEEQGHLWEINYPLTDGSGHVTVATTRPETLFGDVAVAVHPEDERYKKLHGKTVKLPLTEREIPIITDDFVDKDFGSGAVKITPAHDPNDYEVGERHDLPRVTVIDHEGKLTEEANDFAGLEVEPARKAVVKALKEQGFLGEIKDHTHNVGHCYKCGTVLQPLLRDQWFVRVRSLAERAIKALEQGKITFHPDARRQQLISYLENLRDWNISRQIVWGIPIPAFQNLDQPDDWIFDNRVTEEFIEVDGKRYRRDPDVFDTWFSSSSWPFVTLGYPENDELKDFYPNSLMETGFDILYPWVGRMIMMGLYVTDKVPFTDVYLHGLVLDEHGQKMSKSKGNVIDPMEIVDEYGSDALRMGVIAGTTPGTNQPFSPPKVVSGRNFANKVWNVARFIEGIVGDDFHPSEPTPESSADHWILQRLNETSKAMTAELDSYRFSEAYERVYHFVWDDVADWYIEASKSAQNASVLAYVLESSLTLLHPFAPFVTETIWQALGWRDEMLIGYHWPEAVKFDKKHAEEFAQIQQIVTETRYITTALRTTRTTLYHRGVSFLADNADLIKRLARIEAVAEVEDGDGLHLTSTKHDCWLDVNRATAEAYLDDVQTKIDETKVLIERLNGRLSNESYVKGAPARVVDQTKQQLKDAEEHVKTLEQEHKRFATAS